MYNLNIPTFPEILWKLKRHMYATRMLISTDATVGCPCHLNALPKMSASQVFSQKTVPKIAMPFQIVIRYSSIILRGFNLA